MNRMVVVTVMVEIPEDMESEAFKKLTIERLEECLESFASDDGPTFLVVGDTVDGITFDGGGQ